MPTDDQDSNEFISKEPNGSIESYRHLLASADNDPPLPRDRDSPTGSISNEVRPSSQRQSSLSHPRPPGTPRTTNRVRFDIGEPATIPQSEEWVDEEDYLNSPSQHAPLLTDITPPSQSPFLSESFQPEDYLPDARPKSGMRSAFMNMANSIIGAGIIGQPYAFRQAGMTMGIVLLVALTVTVDWTIRLIVINSKLSGADSFQATMQHCFGSSGLVAISVAQWAFAFGGMIAFCIIVGDTIPHVIEALIPGLRDVPFLWLLTDRRAVIVLFILGISWPLSLYRDIAKVRSVCGGIDLRLTSIARQSIYIGIDQHAHHYCHGCHSRSCCRSRSTRRSERIALRQRRILSGCWGHLIWYDGSVAM